MNNNIIHQGNPPSLSTNLPPEDIDLTLFSTQKKKHPSSSNPSLLLSNIIEDINNTKKEILQLKDKNKNINSDTYFESYRSQNRKIDPDSILENISAINTSQNNSISEVDVNSNKTLSYNLNELTQEEIDLFNFYGGKENISIKTLLGEICKKNSKINEMEKESENSNSSTICDSERKYIGIVKELTAIKNNYEKDKEDLMKENEELIKENELLRKGKELLINELAKEKYLNYASCTKYEKIINDFQNNFMNFKNKWNKNIDN